MVSIDVHAEEGAEWCLSAVYIKVCNVVLRSEEFRESSHVTLLSRDPLSELSQTQRRIIPSSKGRVSATSPVSLVLVLAVWKDSPWVNPYELWHGLLRDVVVGIAPNPGILREVWHVSADKPLSPGGEDSEVRLCLTVEEAC